MAEIGTAAERALSGAVRCEQCDDRGWIVTPDGGAGEAKTCACRTTAQPITQRLRAAGVGADLLYASLESWDASANGELDSEVLAYAANPRGFLTLLGDPGRGKSHVAAGILRAHLLRGGSGRWCDLQIFVQSITGTGNWERGRAEEEAMVRAGLLTLDDLGAERETPYSREVVTRMIRSRHVDQAPTIFTSNLSIDQLMEWEPRIVSRLGAGPIVALGGEDYRLVRRLRQRGGPAR